MLAAGFSNRRCRSSAQTNRPNTSVWSTAGSTKISSHQLQLACATSHHSPPAPSALNAILTIQLLVVALRDPSRPRTYELCGSDQTCNAGLGHPAGHDRPLDLAGAFPDPLHAQLAEEPLGDVLAHVATATEHLHGAVGYAVGHL